MADAALELHLPEPVLRVDVAKAEQTIELVRREDVRNGVRIAHDVDRARETRDHLATLADGGRFPGWENLLPLLAPRTLTLADLLPDAIWVAK